MNYSVLSSLGLNDFFYLKKKEINIDSSIPVVNQQPQHLVTLKSRLHVLSQIRVDAILLNQKLIFKHRPSIESRIPLPRTITSLHTIYNVSI